MSDDDWRERDLQHTPPDDRDEEYVKWRLKRHSDTLKELADSAPVPWVAEKCRDLSRQIDSELRVDERRFTHTDTLLPESVAEWDEPGEEVLEAAEEDGPLDEVIFPKRRQEEVEYQPVVPYEDRQRTAERSQPRSIAAPLLVIASALVLLSVIAALVWWSRTPERAEPGTPALSAGPTINVSEDRPAADIGLPSVSVEPQGHDYGLVLRGQRVSRTFVVRNLTGETLDIRLQRSQCRCLWYQYDDELEPGETVQMVIAVDGGKAPSGRLTERIGILSRKDPITYAEVRLTAVVE